MRYVQCGEQRGIGDTCHFLELGGKKIVVDCGIGFENSGNEKFSIYPAGNFFIGEDIAMIIITHAHIDHLGLIARFCSEHPEAIIVITDKALEAAEIMLFDALKINERNLEADLLNGNSEADMMFDEKDIIEFINSPNLEIIREEEMPCWISPWFGWNIGFASAGHDVGAMMIFIQPYNDRPVLITGDVASHDQEIKTGEMLPPIDFLQDFLELPRIVMITEGTNGHRPMKESRKITTEKFIALVNLVKNTGGQVLLPAFAKNRASNLTLILIKAGFTPHVDGLARNLMRVEIPNFDDLVEQGKIILFENGKDGNYHRKMVAAGQDPCGHEFSPVISPSATMDQGFAVFHASNFLEERRNAVIFTGHIFDESTAHTLMNIEQGVEKGRTISLGRVSVDVRCDVHYFDFTAHDYQQGLVERVRQVGPRDSIIHHCTREGFSCMAMEIAKFERPPMIHRAYHQKEIIL